MEEPITPADLVRDQEVFLTNVVTGPVSVISIDRRPVGAGGPGRVSLALASSYAAEVDG